MHKNEVFVLDNILDRILSLIPKKPDWTFVHGALKEFAESIGLKSGLLKKKNPA